MESFVYCWTDRLTNKLYIGVHKGQQDDGYVCSSKLMKEEYKIRPNDFSRQVIASGSLEDMEHFETAILRACNAARDPMFYNQHNGDGKFYNKGFSQDTKMKLKEAWIRRKNNPDYRPPKPSEENIQKLIERNKGNQYCKGRIISEEHKRKIAESLQGKKRPEETCKKMSESMKGKKHTEETKKRIGEASKGNTYALGIKQSQETIAKRIASRKGYKPSDETKEKMRGNTYRLGKKHSEETKQKMKDSHKVSDRSHIVVNEETKNKMRESAKRGWEKRRGG